MRIFLRIYFIVIDTQQQRYPVFPYISHISTPVVLIYPPKYHPRIIRNTVIALWCPLSTASYRVSLLSTFRILGNNTLAFAMRLNETIFEEGAKISQEASSPLTPDLWRIVSSFGVDSPRVNPFGSKYFPRKKKRKDQIKKFGIRRMHGAKEILTTSISSQNLQGIQNI